MSSFDAIKSLRGGGSQATDQLPLQISKTQKRIDVIGIIIGCIVINLVDKPILRPFASGVFKDNILAGSIADGFLIGTLFLGVLIMKSIVLKTFTMFKPTSLNDPL